MMKNIFLLVLSVIFLSSCASFKNLEYKPILSLSELDGIYADTMGNFKTDSRVSYSLGYLMEQDTADVYEFQFLDDKHLKISTLTESGFLPTKTHKGKYNRKEKYFEITIEKKYFL